MWNQLVLHAQASRFHPGVGVSFELRVRKSGRGRVALMRVDWRSLSDGHTVNGKWAAHLAEKGLSRLKNRKLSDTHYHPFDMNWNARRKRFVGQNLPIADNIQQPLDDFSALCTFTAVEFKITNFELVPPPDWQYDLFRGARI